MFVHRLSAGLSGHRLTHGGSRRSAGQVVHVGDDARRFDFENALHFLVVFLRKFTGAMLEAQIAYVLVNGVATLEELIEARAVRSKVGRFELDAEDEP